MLSIGVYVYCSEENILRWSLSCHLSRNLNKVPVKSTWIEGAASAMLRMIRTWGV